MDYNRYEQAKDIRKIEEYKNNPMINYTDSINRSRIGDLDRLTSGGFLSKAITVVIIFVIMFLVSRCTY